MPRINNNRTSSQRNQSTQLEQAIIADNTISHLLRLDPDAHCGQGLGQQRDYYYGCLNRPPLKSAIPTAHTTSRTRRRAFGGVRRAGAFVPRPLIRLLITFGIKSPLLVLRYQLPAVSCGSLVDLLVAQGEVARANRDGRAHVLE